jgi:glycogen debranching enzyme
LDYVDISQDNGALLAAPVLRLWPSDDSEEGPGREESLADTIQEALARHLAGTRFRERGAGKAIDEHMEDNGFNVEIGVRRDTGFVFGGNASNCGTWMDKMGSSVEAGSRGRPSSPR